MGMARNGDAPGQRHPIIFCRATTDALIAIAYRIDIDIQLDISSSPA